MSKFCTEETPSGDLPRDPMTKFHGSMKGRRCKWIPQKIVDADTAFAAELEHLYGVVDKNPVRVRAFFVRFTEINGLNASASLGPWIGQMRRCKLLASTVNTYLEHVSSLFSGSNRVEYRKWAKICGLAHADEEGALPLKATLCLKSLRSIEQRCGSDPPLSALSFILTSTGSRCRDASRLRRSQIRFGKSARGGSQLIVMWRITKTRRKRWLRHTLRIPFSWSGKPSEVTRKYITQGDPNQRLFTHYRNASSFNRALKVTGRVVGKVTSKTFRRAFINRLLRRFGEDAMQVKRFTGHFKESCIQAFYDDFKRDAK